MVFSINPFYILHRSFYRIILPFILFFLYTDLASAQGSKAVRCPRPGRTQSYMSKPPFSVSAGVGLQQAFIISKPPAGAEHYYNYSRPGILVQVSSTQRFNSGIGLMVGLHYYRESVGLRFNYEDAIKDIFNLRSTVAELSLAPVFYLSENLQASLGASISLNLFSETEQIGGYDVTGGDLSQVSGYKYHWDIPEFATTFYPSMFIRVAYNITNRFTIEAKGRYNLRTSPAALRGTTEINFQDGSTALYSRELGGVSTSAGFAINYTFGRLQE